MGFLDKISNVMKLNDDDYGEEYNDDEEYARDDEYYDRSSRKSSPFKKNKEGSRRDYDDDYYEEDAYDDAPSRGGRSGIFSRVKESFSSRQDRDDRYDDRDDRYDDRDDRDAERYDRGGRYDRDDRDTSRDDRYGRYDRDDRGGRYGREERGGTYSKNSQSRSQSSYQPSVRKPTDSEVCIMAPTEVDHCRDIANVMLSGRTVVLNLDGVQYETAQRIGDFCFGAMFALGGDFKKISNSIILFTPCNVSINDDVESLFNAGKNKEKRY